MYSKYGSIFGENNHIMNLLDNVVTVKEYCKIMGVPDRTIRQKLQYGVLPEGVIASRKTGVSKTDTHLLLLGKIAKNKKK